MFKNLLNISDEEILDFSVYLLLFIRICSIFNKLCNLIQNTYYLCRSLYYHFYYYLLKFFEIMAIIKQGILGGFSGKIGNIIGSSWKGIAVVKTKPMSVANPQTAPQVAQRSKFTNCVAFATDILSSVIKPLCDRFSIKMSGFNSFVGLNTYDFTNPYPSTPNELIISKGKLGDTPIATAALNTSTKELTFTWVDDSNEGYKLSTDKVYFVLKAQDSTPAMGGITTETRVDEASLVTLDADLDSQTDYQLFVMFKRADGTQVSNTAFKMCTVS